MTLLPAVFPAPRDSPSKSVVDAWNTVLEMVQKIENDTLRNEFSGTFLHFWSDSQTQGHIVQTATREVEMRVLALDANETDRCRIDTSDQGTNIELLWNPTVVQAQEGSQLVAKYLKFLEAFGLEVPERCRRLLEAQFVSHTSTLECHFRTGVLRVNGINVGPGPCVTAQIGEWCSTNLGIEEVKKVDVNDTTITVTKKYRWLDILLALPKDGQPIEFLDVFATATENNIILKQQKELSEFGFEAALVLGVNFAKFKTSRALKTGWAEIFAPFMTFNANDDVQLANAIGNVKAFNISLTGKDLGDGKTLTDYVRAVWSDKKDENNYNQLLADSKTAREALWKIFRLVSGLGLDDKKNKTMRWIGDKTQTFSYLTESLEMGAYVEMKLNLVGDPGRKNRSVLTKWLKLLESAGCITSQTITHVEGLPDNK